jgi:sugar (pentulose or hexulose) kinase
MSLVPVIAIFDIGRTHKKFLLFDEAYRVVEETSTVIADIPDGDGGTCEDLASISAWMKEQVAGALKRDDVAVGALNFSSHGASLAHLNEAGAPVTPLYDYMKPLPEEVTEPFYALFGGRHAFSLATGSPALDMLNSGIQLYWLKHFKPALFSQVRTSLHLPQYGNYLFSGERHADISSIGCHTGLWDVEQQHYHRWLRAEGVDRLLPAAEPVTAFDNVLLAGREVATGIGLHDSSAALLPFVYTAQEPFLLLSSGTWNITLDPFFEGSLSAEDYRRDCLYYLLDAGRRVAASRLFLGHEYQHQLRKLEDHFHKAKGYYLQVTADAHLFEGVLDRQSERTVFYPEAMAGTGPFPRLKGPAPDLGLFASFEEAYHKLMLDLTWLQKASVELLTGSRPVRRLYISGGFVQSQVFMELLSAFLPGWQIYIAENKRASALGAAVALHEVWHSEPLWGSVSPIVPFQPTLAVAADRYHSFFDTAARVR